jgi:hypothetical protein
MKTPPRNTVLVLATSLGMAAYRSGSAPGGSP